MTDQEIFERANRARAAWDEFIEPFIASARADYITGLTDVAANEPWQSDKIVKLAIATRVIDKVEEQFHAVMLSGDSVARKAARAEQIAQIPARKRRWADMLGA